MVDAWDPTSFSNANERRGNRRAGSERMRGGREKEKRKKRTKTAKNKKRGRRRRKEG